MVSGYIKSSVIEGGSLKIGGTGGTFNVNEDGSVQILGPNHKPIFATFRTEITYTGSTIISESHQSRTLTCAVYQGNEDITDEVIAAGGTFQWIRTSNADDSAWNNAHPASTSNTITITNADIAKNAEFSCEVIFDDAKLTS